ncbi:MAG: hypothetical protein ACRDQ6_13625 [Pseudonocardiaceae bacterium]
MSSPSRGSSSAASGQSFPPVNHGTELAQVGAGDTVAVFCAGSVGLMAAHSAVSRRFLWSTRNPTGWRLPNGSVQPR